MAIASFRGRWTEAVWRGEAAKGFPSDLLRRTQVKLAALNAATSLQDLRVPPSNHLEALKGDRNGQHSIRINTQWRICFVWRDGAPHEVEIVDYH
jgi:proteic killer suppression protein